MLSLEAIEELVEELSADPPDCPSGEAAVLPEDEEADPVAELSVALLSRLLAVLFEAEDRDPVWL